MLTKLLFWSAVAAAVAGMYSPDGNLCWFIAAHLTMLTVGLSLRRRTRPRTAPAPGLKSAAKSA